MIEPTRSRAGAGSPRSTPAYSAKPVTVDLLAAARAVVAAFGAELHAGAPLRPAQYSGLLALERALNHSPGREAGQGSPDHSRPPGASGAHPSRPAADLEAAVGKTGGFCPNCGAPNYGGPRVRRPCPGHPVERRA